MPTPKLAIDQHIATITLQRPEQANRLEPQDLQAIAQHIDTVNANTQVLVLRLQATGKYFCSGFDINQIGQQIGHRVGQSPTVSFEKLVDALEQARPVTIALLHGSVYGGATDLALACDFRIGAEGIDMFMPAARLGLHYYPSGLARYVSRLGVDTAKRLFLTAEKINAEEMRACGFLTQLVATDALEATGDALAATLAAMAPLPLLGMKKHLNALARGALDAAALEADIAQCMQSADIKEGQAAWTERRVPRFTGR